MENICDNFFFFFFLNKFSCPNRNKIKHLILFVINVFFFYISSEICMTGILTLFIAYVNESKM